MNTYLYGKVLDFDVVNGNNRVYTKDSVLKAIEQYNKKSNKLSEVCPTERRVTINIDNVGAVCDEIVVDETSMYAKLRIIHSKQGDVLRDILIDKGNVQLSLRGTATPLLLDDNELQINDLDIISIDVLPFDGSDESMKCTVKII